MPRFKDLNGLRFGRLQIIKRVENQGVQTVWLCQCDCGKEARVISQNLTSGRQISCGCYDYERKTMHGATRQGTVTGEYSTWKAMKNRCYRESSSFYKDYGGQRNKGVRQMVT